MVSADAFRSFVLLLPLTYPNQAPVTINRFADDDSDNEVGDGGGGSSSSWNYGDIDAWGDLAPVCDTGKRQSPIHLRTASSFVTALPPLRYVYYDMPLTPPLILRNNGHTIDLAVPPTTNGRQAYITGGRLNGKFEAVGVHFHWGGPDGAKGSEHKINGMRYDVEMHIVHKNVRYNTTDEASMHKDGLAVLGVMMNIDDDADNYYPGLNKIFKQLPNLTDYMSNSTIRGRLALQQLLGDINVQNFYTYFGSLTTPNCAEAVTWNVFPEPLRVQYSQISKFWDILDNRNLSLNENYRPLQARNMRPVYYRPSRQMLG